MNILNFNRKLWNYYGDIPLEFYYYVNLTQSLFECQSFENELLYNYTSKYFANNCKKHLIVLKNQYHIL